MESIVAIALHVLRLSRGSVKFRVLNFNIIVYYPLGMLPSQICSGHHLDSMSGAIENCSPLELK